MTTLTAKANPATRLRSEADAAWDVYANTCRYGGTPDERDWAFGRAVQAEEKAARAERQAASDKPATR